MEVEKMPNSFSMREYAYYCPKCGQCHFITYGNDEKCLVCKSKMLETPHEYCLTRKNFGIKCEEFEQNQQRLMDEIISKSPQFDKNLYDNRKSILDQQYQQQQDAITHGKAIWEGRDKGNEFGVECPYCHATNIRKISVTSRVASTLMFGLGSKKIGKQWHCDKCGSDF